LYCDEVGERQLIGPEAVQDTKEKVALIRKRMLTTQVMEAPVIQPQILDRIRQAISEFQEEASGFYLTEKGILNTSSGRTVIPNDAC